MTGEPSHVELGVPDVEAARVFYGTLLGWEIGGGAQGGEVRTASLNIGVHGGDPATAFEVFFAVPDLDGALARLASLGGRTVSEVTAGGTFGRWVECADDQGVRFGLREVAE
jgi:uncharacterized protein